MLSKWFNTLKSNGIWMHYIWKHKIGNVCKYENLKTSSCHKENELCYFKEIIVFIYISKTNIMPHFPISSTSNIWWNNFLPKSFFCTNWICPKIFIKCNFTYLDYWSICRFNNRVYKYIPLLTVLMHLDGHSNGIFSKLKNIHFSFLKLILK